MNGKSWVLVYNFETGQYEPKFLELQPLPPIKDFTEEEMQSMGFLKLGTATEDGVL